MSRVGSLVSATVLLFVIVSYVAGPARALTSQGQSEKAPVPDAAALASARERVRSMRADDYAQARSAAGKEQLARALLEDSQLLADDVVARYALLMEAYDLAVEAAACELSLDVIERICAGFDPIDRSALRRDAVLRIAPAVKQGQIACVAGVGLEMAGASLLLDDAPGAGELLRAVSLPIRKHADADTKARLKAAEEELAGVERFTTALATLAGAPEDPEANRVVGLHHAFRRSDMERGLPFLARAPEGPLTSCAVRDVAGPVDAPTRIALGDAWLAWSRKPNLKSAWFSGARLQEASACDLARVRAIHWYTLAAEQLPELERLPVQEKIAAARAIDFAAPAPTAAPKLPPRSKTPELDAAVQRALAWLAAHQSDDGSWDCDGYTKNCGELGSSRCDGVGSAVHDVGVTGLAVLAFLRVPPVLRDVRHETVIRGGLEWLARQQDAEGCFGKRRGQAFLYDHACAALAMMEACATMDSEEFHRSAQGALHFVRQAQNPYSGWRYNVPPDGDSDTSVTGWMVMVLKAARQAGFTVEDDVFENAVSYVDLVTDPANGRTGYQGMGQTSARLPQMMERFPSDHTEAMTAVGIAVRFATGRTPEDDPMLSKGADLMLRQLPRWDGSHIDFYYWYYGTLALSQVGGARWDKWREALRAAVVDHQQVAENDLCGSWEPVDPWSTEGGRIYATALNCMALEALYR